MKKKWIVATLITGSCLMQSCKEHTSNQPVLTKEITFKEEGRITLYKKDTQAAIQSFNIELADDAYERQTGLMYRKSMEQSQGMLFLFENQQPRGFYMKNTEFPLDILYINSDKEIVKIYTMTTPFDPASLPSQVPIQYVLEVNGGVTSTYGIQEGDRVEWELN